MDESANMAVLDGNSRLSKGGSKVTVKVSTRGAVNGSWGRNSGLMTTNASGNNGQRRWGGGGGGSERIPWKNLWNEGTDAVMDIPIGGVCQVLYGDARDADT